MLARFRPTISSFRLSSNLRRIYPVSQDIGNASAFRISWSPFSTIPWREMSTASQYISASNQDLFKYTSGRYLYNEPLRLAERYVKFNIDALKKVTAQSVNRDDVVSIRKLAEGGFNRVLLVTLNDGFEVIVKIPYSIAVPKRLTTESEAATLTFLRSKGIPVPQVYAWSSDPENEVGTEYIIMEKAAGSPLENRWFTLTPKERANLVTSYVDIERKLFSFRFVAYGSIYFKESLPGHLRACLYASDVEDLEGYADRFCIGPIADYMFWRGKRAELEINRGPWKDQRGYLYSTARKEREMTSKSGKPKTNTFPHNQALEGVVSPDKYVDLLDKFLSVSPYLLPEDHSHPVNQPTLRHPDLNPTNIYVSDSCKISCILDWQHTTILPLLLTAGNPPIFENPDPEPPKDFNKPTIPEDYNFLGSEEKSQVDELHRRRMLFYLYMLFNAKDNKPHDKALRYPALMLIQHLADRAGRPWTGNIITLKGALLRVISSWDAIMLNRSAKVPCPVHFDTNDEKEFYEVEENWFKSNFLVEHWRSQLEIGQDGWVGSESFEDVVEANQRIKQEWVDMAKEEEGEEGVRSVEDSWPFQDHEEDE